MMGYITVKQSGRFEYEDRKSVFIGHAMPVSDENSALEALQNTLLEFTTASQGPFLW